MSNVKKVIVLLSILLCITYTANANQQKIQRPQWEKRAYKYINIKENLNCWLDFRQLMLYTNDVSRLPDKQEILPNTNTNGAFGFIKNIKKKTFKPVPLKIALKPGSKNECYVVQGTWVVPDKLKTENLYINDPKELEIDHILPWDFLVKYILPLITSNEQIKYVYSYENNLRITTKQFNRQKGNKLCLTNQDCLRQYLICQEMVTWLLKDKNEKTAKKKLVAENTWDIIYEKTDDDIQKEAKKICNVIDGKKAWKILFN